VRARERECVRVRGKMCVDVCDTYTETERALTRASERASERERERASESVRERGVREREDVCGCVRVLSRVSWLMSSKLARI